MAFPPRGLWHRTAIPYGWFSRWRTSAGVFSTHLLEQTLNTFQQTEVAGAVTDTNDATVILGPRPVNGYFLGGENGHPTVESIKSLTLATETLRVIAKAYGGERWGAGCEYDTTGTGYRMFGTSPMTDTLSATCTAFSAYTETSREFASGLAARVGPGCTESSAAGYVGGGQTGSQINAIAKNLFSSETLSTLAATLVEARNSAAGVESTTNGYYCSGNTATPSAEIDGVKFADDTAINPAATISVARYAAVGMSADTAGYIAGGNDGVPTDLNSINKLTFSGETRSVLGAVLSNPTWPCGTVESLTTGFIVGSGSGAIEKLTFGTETTSVSGTALSEYEAKQVSFAPWVSQSSSNAPEVTTAWESGSLGGLTISGSGSGYLFDSSTNVYKLAFQSESTSTLSSVLPVVIQDSGNFSAPFVGYKYLGVNTNSTYASLALRFSYYAETASSLAVGLRAYVGNSTGVASSSAGYIGGGTYGTDKTIIDRMPFYSETFSTISAALGTARSEASNADSADAGYFVGGYIGDPTYAGTSVIDGVTFSTDSSRSVSATLGTIQKRDKASVEYATTAFFAGGVNETGRTDTIERFTYSTEVLTSIAAVLGIAKANNAGVSSGTKGYFCGGSDGGANVQTEIYALTFSGETVATLGSTLPVGYTANDRLSYTPAGNFYSDSRTEAATAAATQPAPTLLKFGLAYIGHSITSVMSKLRFVDDTIVSASTRTQTYLPSQGMSNGDIGYNAQGDTSSRQVLTTVFSTETYGNLANLLPTPARYNFAATKSSSTLYLAGDFGESSTEIVKMPFSTETPAAASTSMPAAVSRRAGVSSLTYGYYAGGHIAAGFITAIRKIAFSDDSVSTSGTSLSSADGHNVGVYSPTKGYLTGSWNSVGPQVDTLRFSDDTLGSVAISIAADRPVGVQSIVCGYSCGGLSATSVQRIQFSSDSVSVLSATLPQAQHGGLSVSFDGDYSSLHEPANATAAQSLGSTVFSGSDTAAGTATDTTTVDKVANAAATETGTATATHSVTGLFVGVVTEAATAGDTPTSFALMGSVATEAASATDLPSVIAALYVSDTESGSATDLVTVTMFAPVSATEAATAGDTKDAGNSIPVVRTEPASATEVEAVAMLALGSATETASALDTLTTIKTLYGDATEAASAGAVPVAAFFAVGAIVEAGSADSAQEAGGSTVHFVSFSAGATADAVPSASMDAAVSAVESATAGSGQTVTAVVTVLGQEAGVASDQPGVVATFVVTQAESAAAATLASSDQSIQMYAAEAAFAAATVLAQIYGAGYVKTIRVQVGTKRLREYVFAGTTIEAVAAKSEAPVVVAKSENKAVIATSRQALSVTTKKPTT